ncbi:hypothetical protein AB0H77_08495 [Streptomyces sp. NPDC050844]|uniref:hypothetical protein n=1 Tax=Streptomyces sp. NPDC050844 TaxID=3155790 RepID=UPI0033F991AF
MEALLLVALRGVAFAGRGGDADGFAVLVVLAEARNGEQVIPAVAVAAAASLELVDGEGCQLAGAVVEGDALVYAAIL